MFARAVLDRAHRFHRPLVVDVDVGAHARIGRGRLLVRIETVVVGLVLPRHVVRQFIEFEALFAHFCLVDRLRIAGEDGVPVAVLVIDRHMPLGDGHFRAHGNDEGMREELIGHPHMGALVVDLAERDQPQAVFGVLDIDDRAIVFAQHLRHRHIRVRRCAAELLAIGRRGILVLEEAMKERGMRRIDADFERLQPVARHQPLERKGVRIRRDEAVDFRKCRRLALAEIRPEDAALLDDGIGPLLDVLAERRARRFGGRFETLAGDIEQPAMKGAAKSAVFQPTEREVGAAMRTVAVHQTVTALLVTEENEVLAEQLDRPNRARPLQFVHQRCRLPVHAHQLAGRGRRTDPGNEIVLLLTHHGLESPLRSEALRLESVWTCR